MKISNPHAPLLISAVRDAIRYNNSLLESETIRDKSDLEDYIVQLTTMYEFICDEYRKNESQYGIPLKELEKS